MWRSIRAWPQTRLMHQLSRMLCQTASPQQILCGPAKMPSKPCRAAQNQQSVSTVAQPCSSSSSSSRSSRAHSTAILTSRATGSPVRRPHLCHSLCRRSLLVHPCSTGSRQHIALGKLVHSSASSFRARVCRAAIASPASGASLCFRYPGTRSTALAQRAVPGQWSDPRLDRCLPSSARHMFCGECHLSHSLLKVARGRTTTALCPVCLTFTWLIFAMACARHKVLSPSDAPAVCGQADDQPSLHAAPPLQSREAARPLRPGLQQGTADGSGDRRSVSGRFLL